MIQLTCWAKVTIFPSIIAAMVYPYKKSKVDMYGYMYINKTAPRDGHFFRAKEMG